MLWVFTTTLCLLAVTVVQGLDNGLARTPPMGWLSWERFRCNTNCKNDPENCIGEKLFMTMADHIVSDGYKDAGYEYVSIDDCWLAMERDSKGRLQPDPERFPSGIKALADYMHKKGLKLGIYEDFGTKTCAGYPGSEYYLQTDAQTFADWGVDLLKLDGCNSDPKQYDQAYPAVSYWLNATGRPILFSCSWPAYQEGSGIKPNYKQTAQACNSARNYNDIEDSWESVSNTIDFVGSDEFGFAEVAGPGFWNDPDMPDYPSIAKYCNIWRNAGDIDDSWNSVVGILDFYGSDKTKFTEVAGPGNFNDPDMLIIGNYGLSYDQQRVQMALWAIMASPLIMSVDLRTIRAESKALLQNKAAIAINQDALGKQGKRIAKMGSVQVWTRPLFPVGSVAVAFLNTGFGGGPASVSVKLTDLGMTHAKGYSLVEVFDGKSLGKMLPNATFSCHVNPTGVTFMGSVQVWTRPLFPVGSVAVAFLNTGFGGGPASVSVKLTDLGMTHAKGYSLVEVFDGKSLGKMLPNATFSCHVNPTGVTFVRATPL